MIDEHITSEPIDLDQYRRSRPTRATPQPPTSPAAPSGVSGLIKELVLWLVGQAIEQHERRYHGPEVA